MGWLENQYIRATERATSEDAGYLRQLLKGGRAGFWKFALTMPMVMHQKHVDRTLWHLARIAAIQVEDCGHCLQTVVTMAEKDGINSDILQISLGMKDGFLSDTQQAALDLGRSIAGGVQMPETERQRLQDKLGDKAFSELVLGALGARQFPALKRGFGLTTSCSLIKLTVKGA